MMALATISKILHGDLAGENIDFTAVSIDTRKLQPGDLYVAIQGESFDGHDFVDQAARQGAVAVIVHKEIVTDLPVIKVADTRVALGQIAAAWREEFKGKVVAITGSNGKTTVKEMVSAIMSTCGDVVATKGNFNNDIGLPLTLLRMQQEGVAVIEMGANHKGEIANLTGITRPDVVLINNAAHAHLEGFGSLQGVAEAKGEIIQGLSDDGVAVINKDDQYATYWCDLASENKIIQFSMKDKTADVFGEWMDDASGGTLKIASGGFEFTLHLNVYGLHNAMNALAAIAITRALNVDNEHIISALQKFNAVKGRLNFHRVNEKLTVIDDTYNANPDSLLAAMKVLKKTSGQHWLVLGDMGELDDEQQVHIDAGMQASELGIHCLLTIGKASQYANDVFVRNAIHFEKKSELVDFINQHQTEHLKILVKGSRFMQMEQIVDCLIKEKI